MTQKFKGFFLAITLLLGAAAFPLTTNSSLVFNPVYALEVGVEGESEVDVKVGSDEDSDKTEIKSETKAKGEVKSESEMESKIEIEVYVKGNQTTIKIEKDDKENTYMLETSSETEIVAKIMAETNLTEEQIKSIWEYNDSDSRMKAKMMLESEIDAKIKGIANANVKAKEKSKILIDYIENDSENTNKRLNSIMAKARTNGFLKTESSSTVKTYDVSINGIANIHSESDASLQGDIYLEEMTKMANVAKYRVSGGTLTIDGQNYDVLFGKARTTSDGNVESKTKMILIAEVMKPEGDVTTMKLVFQSASSMSNQSETQWDVLNPQSKIAGGWKFDAQSKMSVVSA